MLSGLESLIGDQLKLLKKHLDIFDLIAPKDGNFYRR